MPSPTTRRRQVAAHKASTVLLLHPEGAAGPEALKASAAMCLTALGAGEGAAAAAAPAAAPAAPAAPAAAGTAGAGETAAAAAAAKTAVAQKQKQQRVVMQLPADASKAEAGYLGSLVSTAKVAGERDLIPQAAAAAALHAAAGDSPPPSTARSKQTNKRLKTITHAHRPRLPRRRGARPEAAAPPRRADGGAAGHLLRLERPADAA